MSDPRTDPSRVAAALERVYALEDLPLAEGSEGDFLRQLAERLSGLGLSRAVDAWLPGLLAALAAAGLVGLALRAARALPRATPLPAPSGPSREGAAAARRSARALAERAAAAERTGERALALRLWLFALLVVLSERGDLAFRASWTDRELLERGAPGPVLRAELEALFDELEGKTFGREPVTPKDLERVAARVRERLGEERPA